MSPHKVKIFTVQGDDLVSPCVFFINFDNKQTKLQSLCQNSRKVMPGRAMDEVRGDNVDQAFGGTMGYTGRPKISCG